MASETEMVEERFFARFEAIIAPIMVDGTVAAIGRELVADVRQTFNEVFFGHHEHRSEIGSPLNPLYSDLAEAREFWQEAMTAFEIANDDRPYLHEAAIEQEHDRGHGR